MTTERPYGSGYQCDRRQILRSMGGAAAVSATGLAASATASAQAVNFERRDVVREVRTHGRDTVELLVAEGVIDPRDRRLWTGEPKPLGEFASSSEGMTVVTPEEKGVSTRSVRMKSPTNDGGTVTVVVEPEADRSYAIHQPADGDGERLYAPEADDVDDGTDLTTGEVQAQAESECTDSQCDPIGPLCVNVVTNCVFGYCFDRYNCTCGC